MRRLVLLFLLTLLAAPGLRAEDDHDFVKPTPTPAPVSAFLGSYRTTDLRSELYCDFAIIDTDGVATVDFSIGPKMGHGAAPDGSGPGSDTGKTTFSFTFQDTYGNQGRGTLRQQEGDLYLLTLKLTHPAEKRSASLYRETYTLRKVPGRKLP